MSHLQKFKMRQRGAGTFIIHGTLFRKQTREGCSGALTLTESGVELLFAENNNNNNTQ